MGNKNQQFLTRLKNKNEKKRISQCVQGHISKTKVCSSFSHLLNRYIRVPK